MAIDRGRLQAGIYLRGSELPPAFLFAVLDLAPGCGRAEATEALACVWEMLAELRLGSVRDLAPTRPGDERVSIESETFDALLGYGASFFDPGRDLTDAERPETLVPLRHPGGPFAALRWAPGVAPRSGEGDLCLQLTGRHPHAVARAAVETWKLIVDEGLPLTLRETHEGFARDDGRSWIGFHDGVSNVRPGGRLDAVLCPGDPAWNRGGTYLAFLRCAVDLVGWRVLPRERQELLVGRDKLSGRILEGAAGSHIERANRNRAEPSTHAAHRIFRQGYEYLDGIGPAGPALGLNFVSYQRDLEHLRQVLGLTGWLGGVNFGGRPDQGPDEPEPIELIALRAAGLYAAPPVADPFPGAVLLGRM